MAGLEGETRLPPSRLRAPLRVALSHSPPRGGGELFRDFRGRNRAGYGELAFYAFTKLSRRRAHGLKDRFDLSGRSAIVTAARAAFGQACATRWLSTA